MSSSGEVHKDKELIRNVLGEPIAIGNAISPDANTNPNQQNYTTGADGTILVDRNAAPNGNWLPTVSNTFLREFIHSKLDLEKLWLFATNRKTLNKTP